MKPTLVNSVKIFFVKAQTKIRIEVRNWRYNAALQRILRQQNGRKIPLHILFGNVSDAFWLWLYTEGIRKSDALRRLLPTMPDEHVQLQFTGASGDETLQQAFSMYTLVKDILAQYEKDVKRCGYILDFGCGWGRILRFFLKDVDVSQLYGIDCDSGMIDICQQSNINAEFGAIQPSPPTHFSDNMFDVIYAYSVFSHLSEEIHLKWLQEFQRLLKPQGLLIVTTRPKQFITRCAALRAMNDVPFFVSGAAAAFTDTEQYLDDYDNGKFCFSGTGGGGVRDSSFYGETCIPKLYVERVWTQYFHQIDFIDCDEHKRFDQNVIIAQK